MKRNILFVSIAILAVISCSTSAPVGDGVSITTDVFAVKGADTLKIDTFLDASLPVPEAGRPAIIYIHGGGFTMGERVNAAQEVFCRYMAAKGWIAFSVDYRLAGIRWNEDGTSVNPYGVDGTLSAVRIATADVVDATNYILSRKDWNVDPGKICLGGGSAGAVTSLQLVYDSCNGEDYTNALPEGFVYAGAISQAGCIGTPGEDAAWKTAPCPIMFFHGDRDIVVPLETLQMDCKMFGTLYLFDQLQEMGVPCWKWIEHGADHVMAMKPLTTYLEEQYRFLNDFVVNGVKSTVVTEVTDAVPAGMSSIEEMVKYVPLYIFGYGKYLEEIDWNAVGMPSDVLY